MCRKVEQYRIRIPVLTRPFLGLRQTTLLRRAWRRLHQAANHLKLPILTNRDDRAGAGFLCVRPPFAFCLERRHLGFERRQHAGIVFPAVALKGSQHALMPLGERGELPLLRLAQPRLHRSRTLELRQERVVGRRMDFHPLPTFSPHDLRRRLKLLGRQTVEKLAVAKMPLALGLEQIADDRAASFDKSLFAHEPRAPVSAVDQLLGQELADPAWRHSRIGITEPGLFLDRMIVRKGEGRELLKRHAFFAIDLDQFRRHRCQLEPLLNEGRRHAIACGDVVERPAFFEDAREGLELIRRMQVQPKEVLAERHLHGVCSILAPYETAYQEVAADPLAFGEQLQGREPATAGRHLMRLPFVGSALHRAHDEVFEQPLRADVVRQSRNSDQATRFCAR